MFLYVYYRVLVFVCHATLSTWVLTCCFLSRNTPKQVGNWLAISVRGLPKGTSFSASLRWAWPLIAVTAVAVTSHQVTPLACLFWGRFRPVEIQQLLQEDGKSSWLKAGDSPIFTSKVQNMNMILSASIHISHSSSSALKCNLSQLQPDSITQLSGLLVLDFSSKKLIKR